MVSRPAGAPALASLEGPASFSGRDYCYDFDYDEAAWQPVALSPIRTKPGKAQVGYRGYADGPAFHTVVHVPLEGGSPSLKARTRRGSLFVVLAAVLAFLLASVALLFVQSRAADAGCWMVAATESTAQTFNGRHGASMAELYRSCVTGAAQGDFVGPDTLSEHRHA